MLSVNDARSKFQLSSLCAVATLLAVSVGWIAPPLVAPVIVGGLAGVLMGLVLHSSSYRSAALHAGTAAALIILACASGIVAAGAIGPDAHAHAALVTARILTPIGFALLGLSTLAGTLGARWVAGRSPRAHQLVTVLVVLGLCVVVVAGAMTLLSSAGVVSELEASAALAVPAKSDQALYAWVLQDMAHGEGYYASMAEGLELGGILGPSNWVPFNFRLPAIFYLWLGVGGGGVRGIASLAIVLAVLSVTSSYLLARRFTTREVAILAPLTLVPLLIGITSGDLFLLTDPWAGMLSLLAVTAWVYRDRVRFAVPLAASLALAAFACREFAGTLLAAGLLAACLERDKRAAGLWIAALAGALGMELANYYAVGKISSAFSTSVSMWTASSFSFDFLLGVIRWGSGLLLHYPTTSVAAFLLAVYGAATSARISDRIGLALVILVPAVFAATIHSTQYEIYNWGLVFTPLMYPLAIIGLSRLLDLQPPDSERSKKDVLPPQPTVS